MIGGSGEGGEGVGEGGEGGEGRGREGRGKGRGVEGKEGERSRKVGVVRGLRRGREDGEKSEGQVTVGDWVLIRHSSYITHTYGN